MEKGDNYLNSLFLFELFGFIMKYLWVIYEYVLRERIWVYVKYKLMKLFKKICESDFLIIKCYI